MTDKSKEALVSRCCKFSCTCMNVFNWGRRLNRVFKPNAQSGKPINAGDKGESFNVVYRDWPAAFCLPRNS